MDLPVDSSVSSSRHMAIKAKGGKWAAHAIRIRVLRTALFNENTAAFGRRLGVASQRISNIENGYPLSIDIANRIRRLVPGMTLDWLYHGDERAIPLETLIRLRNEAGKPEHHPPA